MLRAADLAKLPEAARAAFIARLSPQEAALLPYLWEFWARAEQLLPPGDWVYWLPLGGRGCGKTRTGAETVRRWARTNAHVNIIGATADDVRDVMVEGELGILNVCPQDERPKFVAARTVALQTTLANAHGNGAAVAWDVFASAGPGLNGFTPAGIGIEEEALYDPVSAKYYIERAATQDACPPQNLVLELPGLWNGATMDRAREVIGDAQGATGIPAEALMLWNGASYDRAYGDKTNGLFVNVKQLPTGSNMIGAVVVANNPVGASALATAQASIGTTAAAIVAARTGGSGTGRITATLYNTGAVTVFVGSSGVTTGNGIPVPAGASLTLKTTAALYGITASSSATVGVVETF